MGVYVGLEKSVSDRGMVVLVTKLTWGILGRAVWAQATVERGQNGHQLLDGHCLDG